MGFPLPVAALALGAGALGLRALARRRGGMALGADGPCPGDPPPPSHLKVMQSHPSPELQQWASSIVHDKTTMYGQTFDRDFDGRPITARVEHHTWTTHGAQIIPGCYKGVTLYEHKHTEDAPTAVAGYAPYGMPLYATGQWPVDLSGPPGGMLPYGEEPISRDEAFDAASQLQSMFPGVRALVAQAPDGFYVRVISSLGSGGGGLGRGLGQSLFTDKGPRALTDRDVWRAIDRLPPQIGRVRVVMDRLVSPDFAVAGDFAVGCGGGVGAETRQVSLREARAAQDKLRRDLVNGCKCVLGWMRGVALNVIQERCGPGSKTKYELLLLVDGENMSDEAREMVPSYVGDLPVIISDIGDGPVPRNREIVAP